MFLILEIMVIEILHLNIVLFLEVAKLPTSPRSGMLFPKLM